MACQDLPLPLGMYRQIANNITNDNATSWLTVQLTKTKQGYRVSGDPLYKMVGVQERSAICNHMIRHGNTETDP